MKQSLALPAAALLAFLGLGYLLAAEDEAGAAAPKIEVIEEDMADLMELLFEVQYDRLKKAVAGEEPTLKADWEALQADTLTWAEGLNLVLGRPPHPDDANEWAKLTVESRAIAKKLYDTAKYKRWAEIKPAYEATLKSCNACHDRFADDMRPLKP